jgi:hypothetical protein
MHTVSTHHIVDENVWREAALQQLAKDAVNGGNGWEGYVEQRKLRIFECVCM